MLHQETSRTGCFRCENHSRHLPVETCTACPSPAAQLQGPASGAGGISEERTARPVSLWAVTRSYLLISKINSTMINVMIYSTNDQNHCFSDPRAIKCNHWVIYSGQAASGGRGPGARASSRARGQTTSLRDAARGGRFHAPHAPICVQGCGCQVRGAGGAHLCFFQNDRESLPGVPQSTRWERGKA